VSLSHLLDELVAPENVTILRCDDYLSFGVPWRVTVSVPGRVICRSRDGLTVDDAAGIVVEDLEKFHREHGIPTRHQRKAAQT
jgi:hypothetical protein